MIRIWAVIAGLFLLASSLVGRVVPAGPPPAAAAAFNPAGGAPGQGRGAAPLAQVMQVYVMSPSAANSAGGDAVTSGDNSECQGTAFCLAARGRRVVVAPYHAWVMAGASVESAQAYLAGEVQDAAVGGAPRWTWWIERARVLSADPAHDVVFLAVPPELKDVAGLAPADGVVVGEQLYGSGYAGGMISPNAFSGTVTYCGPETEATGTDGGWTLNFSGYGLSGSGVEAGDSGSPALTADGRVAGEVVAAGNGWILVVPARAIERDLAALPPNPGT